MILKDMAGRLLYQEEIATLISVTAMVETICTHGGGAHFAQAFGE